MSASLHVPWGLVSFSHLSVVQHRNQNDQCHRRLLKDLQFTCNAFLLSSVLTISRCRDLHYCNATLRCGNPSAFSVHLSVLSSNLSAFSTTHHTPFLSNDNS